ncbi:hypothetical protein TOPH_02993 [Tolypocladium ophioglossoides CBS 100239]|uniref:Uncharacterized protein n=1 Tax=Tolypocladium ophioglossoides (strain CBS 100239) TaxID=1163406 RepID=A0A0L0NEP4_TOLOC|nr:hypothetical protein TOPH_02993 [Tolypocladium ophioglossoides CBS 100239]
MTFSSGFHMPGAFHAEGIHQGLIRPPVSPASSSGYLPAARPAPAVVDASTPKRKRNRHAEFARAPNGRHVFDSGPGLDHHHHHQHHHNHDDAATLGTPAPIFGRAYTLAGQLDTPHGGGCGPHDSDAGGLGESMYSDSNYRRALGSKRRREDLDVDTSDLSRPTPLFALPASPVSARPWSTVAFSTIGGVVGKVWEFCKAGAFKGFYAGGGRGYEVGAAERGVMPAGPPCDYAADERRIPGYFPQGGEYHHYPDVAGEANVDSRPSTPSAPAAKRRQTGPADELGRNWVMVKEPGTGADDSTPRRKSSLHQPSPRNRNQGPAVTTGRRISTPTSRNVAAAATSASTPRRYSNRLNAFAATPPVQEPPRPASSASFASPRAPSPTKTASRAAPFATTTSTASSTSYGHSRRRSLNPPASHPSLAHRRTNSNASTASSRAGFGAAEAQALDASPRLDAEAKKLAAWRKMEDRDADVRIAAFNKRLQDMIRQGKEALGTTVEVVGGEGGEEAGWEDDD